jgi:HSF-type DNA-binding
MADASTPPAPTSPTSKGDQKDEATHSDESESANKESSLQKDEPSKVKGVEKLTSLPAIITDEEGTAIPEASNGSMYQYRDFSNVPEEELEQQPMAAPPPPPSRGPVESSIRVQKFPVKLYAILAQKEFADIICWMPHGRSWKVLKPNLFESLVMPLFFEYSNYHSFNRLVNAWSFRRISSGPDRGSYYHELFLRGKPYLQKYMR